MPSNSLILCHPLLLPSVFPGIRIFFDELALHIRWPKYWSSASGSVLPVNIQDWFPLWLTGLISLQSKGLKSLLQHHSSKASILQNSAFFMIQLSNPYMITGKTIALTIQTFVGKVMSLLFNMLSRFIIVFLPRNKCLLISWLQSLSTVILEPKKIACLCFYFSPSICHEVMGMDTTVFVNVVFSWLFHSPLSLSSRGSLVPLHFQP